MEIKDIIKQQEVIEKVNSANADAIKRLEEELVRRKEENVLKEVQKDIDESVNDAGKNEKKMKICRYFNRGYCKYKNKCRFVHSQNICEEYLKNEKCGAKVCTDRHPKKCRWIKTNVGCRRVSECEYLHVTLACNERESFKCAKMFGLIKHVW